MTAVETSVDSDKKDGGGSVPEPRDVSLQGVKGNEPPDEEKGKVNGANFEEAITACGHGKFHYCLILALAAACSAQVYCSTTMSYVIPSAECDLQLSNNDKGAVIAAIYVGLTVGAFFGGFASDVFGRQKLIVIGFFCDFIFNTIGALSHRFWLLFIMKICSGLSLTGPIASVFAYSAETHNNAKRARVIMTNGFLAAVAQGIQPVVAYYLIPLDFRIPLIPGVLDFTSWRLFYFVCTVPSLLACIAFSFFPESPKFLMSRGRTDEALEAFKRIYVANTGKPAHTYPITELAVPAKQARSGSAMIGPSGNTAWSVLSRGWQQIRPVFRPPYLNIALIVFGISACTVFAMNSIRMWVPQLFASLSEAQRLNTTEATTICGLIGSAFKGEVSSSDAAQEGRVCLPVSGEVYLRSFIISATAAFTFLITTPLINYIGKKTFAKMAFPVLAGVVISINWATKSDVFMALLAIYMALIRNCFSIMQTISVDLFPTAFRSVALSLTMMCGRVSSMAGNFLFPVLLDISCNVVFFAIGAVVMVPAVLVWFITDKTSEL